MSVSCREAVIFGAMTVCIPLLVAWQHPFGEGHSVHVCRRLAHHRELSEQRWLCIASSPRAFKQRLPAGSFGNFAGISLAAMTQPAIQGLGLIGFRAAPSPLVQHPIQSSLDNLANRPCAISQETNSERNPAQKQTHAKTTSSHPRT